MTRRERKKIQRRRRLIKKWGALLVAILYTAICIHLWFSGTIVPVYVNGEFVLFNKIVRYMLYLYFGGIAIRDFLIFINI